MALRCLDNCISKYPYLFLKFEYYSVRYILKVSIIKGITKKKEIEKQFARELQEKLRVILPYLEKNSDSRLNLLLKFQGPFCKVEILKTHKHLLRKVK